MLLPLTIDEVRAHWPKIRLGLLQIARTSADTWTPEHVLAKLEQEHAHLWAAPEGFVVFYLRTDEFDGHREMVIWQAFGQGENLMETYLDQLRDIGRACGADRMVWRSNRPGMTKRAIACGFGLRYVEYEGRL